MTEEQRAAHEADHDELDLEHHPREDSVAEPEPERGGGVWRTVRGILLPLLALLTAFVVGGIVIIATDFDLLGLWASDPIAAIGASWSTVADAYGSLIRGSIGDPVRLIGALVALDWEGVRSAFVPLSETIISTTPLILTGLSVALAFRVGLFNIGAEGQLYLGALFAIVAGFSIVGLPWFIHLPIAIAAGFLGGALWGFIPGILKARTGAHEVIVTIMLNFVAFYLISFWLRTPGALQAPGSNNPKSPPIAESAAFPALLGEKYNLNWDFVLVLVAVAFVWWLLNRSSLGFKFRAVGENPNAARVAGISVKWTYVWAMLLSGALVGLAGVSQALGTFTKGFASGVDSNIGFDAITVALLGRSRPIGTLFAGILFGALKAGGYSMQASQGIPIDIVLVIQSLIVLFIAAPPLVRAIFRLPKPGALQPKAPKSIKKAVVTK
jgi:simple sugar transport system permease protein